MSKEGRATVPVFRNPHRHCKCGEEILRTFIVACEQIPGGGANALMEQLQLLRGKVHPRCPGMEMPSPDWRAMEVATTKLIEKVFTEEAEKEAPSDLQTSTVWSTVLEASSARCGKHIITSIYRLWEVLVTGRTPPSVGGLRLH